MNAFFFTNAITIDTAIFVINLIITLLLWTLLTKGITY